MPIARFEMPDGRIARFEVPEGTTPEQAQSMMESYDFGEAQAAPAPEQPKAKDYGIGRTEAAPKNTGFLDQVADNFRNGAQNVLDLARGDYQSFGNSTPGPKGKALADKLLKGISDPSLSGIARTAIHNIGDTVPSDYSAALLEKFNETAPGKAVNAMGGLIPSWNIMGTAIDRYAVTPASDITGIPKENIQLGLMAASPLGLRSGKIPATPEIALAKMAGKQVLNGSSSIKAGAKTAIEGARARTPETLKESAGNMKAEAVGLRTQMKDSGASLTPDASGRLTANLDARLAGMEIIPELSPKSLAIINRIKAKANSGLTLNSLDQYRRMLRLARDEDSAVAGAIRSALDDTVNKLKPSDFSHGGPGAVKLLNQFRKDYAKASRFDEIAEILSKADGDPNKIKTGLTRFAQNSENLRGWSQAEIVALKNAARNSTVDKIYKMVGKFGIDLGNSMTPGNTVLPLLGGFAGTPAVPAIGTASRMMQKYMARGKAENLLKTIEGTSDAAKAQARKTDLMQRYGSSELGRRMANNPDLRLMSLNPQKPTSHVNGAAIGGVIATQGDANSPETAPQPTGIYVNPSVNPYQGGNAGVPPGDLPKTTFEPMSYEGTAPIGEEFLDKVSQAESSGNPNARNPNSTASGEFQFTNGTWALAVNKFGKDLGITMRDKNDPEAQRRMAYALAVDNAKILNGKLGRMPSKGELYVAHFMGASQAAKLINAYGTGQNAARMFPKEAAANRPIFFDRMRPRSVEEVYALLDSKVS